MPLSGKDFKKLQNAMLQAYPNKSDLEQLVRFELNKTLEAIAGGETTRDIIFNLIKWAESTGKLKDLLNAVLKDRSDNEQLQATIKDILAKFNNPPKTVSPQPEPTKTNSTNPQPYRDSFSKGQNFTDSPPPEPTKTNSTNPQPYRDSYSKGKNFTEELPNGVKLEMIAIPEGEFMMGSNEDNTEQPIHKVTLKPFYMGKFPITKTQYRAVMGEKQPKDKDKNKPAIGVNWDKASNFCRILSKITGKSYKLPSEAQWEYACRAGSTTKWCFGDNESELKEYAWYGGGIRGTSPVGLKKPNQWGLYDMHGNVWEWCEDNWHSNYENAPIDGSAWITEDDKTSVQRGGSWYDYPNNCRSAYHQKFDARGNYINFRVVCQFGRTL